VDNRTGCHEQQAFVKNMGKGMGTRAIDSQGGADTHSGYHIAYLTDNLPTEQSPDVVFHHGIDDAVDGHDHAEDNEDFKAGKGSGQRIHCSLGSKGAHEDRPGNGGLAVGIGQP